MTDEDVLSAVITLVLSLIAGVLAIPATYEIYYAFIVGEVSFVVGLLASIFVWGIILIVIRTILAISILIILLLVAGALALIE